MKSHTDVVIGGDRIIGTSIAYQLVKRGIRDVVLVEADNHRVVAVVTNAGRIATPIVVNTAGARAVPVASWVQLNLPIKNYKRMIFITDHFDDIRDDAPFVMDLAVETIWIAPEYL